MTLEKKSEELAFWNIKQVIKGLGLTEMRKRGRRWEWGRKERQKKRQEVRSTEENCLEEIKFGTCHELEE